MESFSSEFFIATLALVGAVILVSALLSGLIERSGVPSVAAFLGIGAALGASGMGLIDISLDAPALRVVATLSLVLVLFTDAVTLDIGEVRRNSGLALLVVGPGTLLTAGLIGVVGWWLLGLDPAQAAILGAALASTDAVLLRGLLRSKGIPGVVRQALRLEGGLNDVALLPIVLVAMLFLIPEAQPGVTEMSRLGIDLFLLGPGAGVAVGLIAVSTLDLVRRRIGVRRDYESLYSLGVALTAFAAAEAVQGSGFLAAFAAGLTISALDVELCDCFLEYGEATAEMLMLFTFVLFGSSLIWSGFNVINGPTLLFAAVVLLGRLPIFMIALAGSQLSWRERLLIAWFGPRGLSSLLIVLLPIFAGLPGSAELFPICSLVVLLSVLVHGSSPLFFDMFGAARRNQAAPSIAEQPPAPPPAHELPTLAAPQHDHHLERGAVPAPRDGTEDAAAEPIDRLRISIAQLRRLWAEGATVFVLDVSTERSYEVEVNQAQGALRIPPDEAVARANELKLPRSAWLIPYCT